MKYLTERVLGEILDESYNIESQVKIGKYKVDFIFGDTVVEFDGFRHYNSAKNNIRDENVNEICEGMGLKVIHIPYFIQASRLDELNGIEVGDKFSEYKEYPCGFIDSKALRPSDFCYRGLVRFKSELFSYPYHIREEILKSMNDEDKLATYSI